MEPPSAPIDPRVAGLSSSATLAINEKCRAMLGEGRTVYRLGFGQSPFPVPLPLVEELQSQAWRKEYLSVRGLPALRQAVVDYHQRRQGVTLAPDRVVVGPGCKELMFLLQLVFDGEVLIPTPAWVSYAPQSRMAGRRSTYLHTRAEDRWLLGADALEAACAEGRRPRLLILNYPGNPSGTTYTAAQLEALAGVAARHGVVVLSDEIYGEVLHVGDHVSLARFHPQGTIMCTGLSKWCGAGGWRVGTLAFPDALSHVADAVAVAASETYTTTAAPVQYAAVRAFEHVTAIDSYLEVARAFLGRLAGMAHRRLLEAGVPTASPDGGFYLFPDFTGRVPGCRDSAEMCGRLLDETGVALLPGSDFGRPPGELTARLAYVDFDGRWALADVGDAGPEAVDDAFVRQHAERVLQGVERLCEWIL